MAAHRCSSLVIVDASWAVLVLTIGKSGDPIKFSLSTLVLTTKTEQHFLYDFS